MYKSLNILKQISANSEHKGKIKVKNDGRFLARYEVNYLIGEVQLTQISGRIYEGQQQTIFIPGLAKNVQIKVEELITGFPEIWKTIFNLEYPYAGNRGFRLWGNSLNAKYGTITTLGTEKSVNQSYEKTKMRK
ncbi:MAG: thiol-activated cytolysin C-terminal domain-containing protein [Bacteroidota bacterium]|nr:thiol-activated cytolysin C-terminal domain-containing protein [Bacteroidota bacterium]